MIRPAVPEDQATLYEICRRTGDAGGDASALYADPDLLGEIWVGPYLELEPELAFVATDNEGPAGYVLGAADTAAFEARCERDWWPRLRLRVPDPADTGGLTPDQQLHRMIHHPPATDPGVLVEYPAHLHIDLLPRAQGHGVGRRLMETFLGTLRRRGVGGVHLGVDPRNHNAIGFYTRLGFARLEPDGDLYGLRL